VSRNATLRADPLVIEPRWLAHLGFVLLMVVAVVTLVVVRRSDDLDFEDELMTAGVLALCFWVLAVGLGSLVRNVRAGHGLRLDAEGLHVPGLAVLPWSSIERVDLRGYGDSGKRLPQLVVHTDALRAPLSLRHYERYLFGPWAGLTGRQGTVLVPIGLLAIEPQALLERARSFVEVAGTRAAMRRNVEASAEERRSPGRRLP
jgi:hypothetical protein